MHQRDGADVSIEQKSVAAHTRPLLLPPFSRRDPIVGDGSRRVCRGGGQIGSKVATGDAASGMDDQVYATAMPPSRFLEDRVQPRCKQLPEARVSTEVVRRWAPPAIVTLAATAVLTALTAAPPADAAPRQARPEHTTEGAAPRDAGERLSDDCASERMRSSRPVLAVNERPAIAAVAIGQPRGSGRAYPAARGPRCPPSQSRRRMAPQYPRIRRM